MVFGLPGIPYHRHEQPETEQEGRDIENILWLAADAFAFPMERRTFVEAVNVWIDKVLEDYGGRQNNYNFPLRKENPETEATVANRQVGQIVLVDIPVQRIQRTEDAEVDLVKSKYIVQIAFKRNSPWRWIIEGIAATKLDEEKPKPVLAKLKDIFFTR